jgi:trk system potassium uptake protein TrkA
MYILIVGGGKVGHYLAMQLLNEGHEILVIEQDRRKCDLINEELGEIALRGDGCEASTLAEAGTGRADMVIAVTGDDEDNLVACQVAKWKFNVKRTVARINYPKNREIFERLGIDFTVSSTDLILEYIEKEVPTHALTRLVRLRTRGLEVVEVRIPDDSPTVGRRLTEIRLPPESVIAVVANERGAMVPTAETVLRGGDELVAVARVENETALRQALTGA